MNNEEIQELEQSYAVVYPISFFCLADGKKLHCKPP